MIDTFKIKNKYVIRLKELNAYNNFVKALLEQKELIQTDRTLFLKAAVGDNQNWHTLINVIDWSPTSHIKRKYWSDLYSKYND